MTGRTDRVGIDRGGDTVAFIQSLRARESEMAALALCRIEAVAPPPSLADDEYRQSLRSAVSAALDYGLATIEDGTGRPRPVPAALLVQARLGARHNVGLDSVLRRYIAGHAILIQFVINELDRSGRPPRDSSPRQTVQLIGVLLDQIIDTVSAEYRRESQEQRRSTSQRELDWVKRLLAGELLFTDRFPYDFDGLHLGIVASGGEAPDAIRSLAKALDHRLLLVRPTEVNSWAWLGMRGDPDWSALERFVENKWPRSVSLAVGEPERGIVGWRRTHEQARAAASVAAHQPGALVRYGPNNLRIAALESDLLRESLREMYLAPLGRAGEVPVLQETLRAYLSTGRNAASTAGLLGISRRTVANRVQLAERLFGRPLTECGSALEVALWLETVERGDGAEGAGGKRAGLVVP